MSKTATKQVTMFDALLPIGVLIILLGLNVYFFSDDASYGPNQVALMLAAGVTALMGMRLGYKWVEMEKGMIRSISSAMQAMLILLTIGALAGTWLISGIIPTMIYYGIQILSPTFFLVSSVIICALISLATGSSWSTIATIGVALLGVGKAMDIHIGLVCGAIISGAYFGDKMSPLSDTTNLAPAMAGTDLFTHIKHMIWTTGPSIIITMIIFTFIGLFTDVSESGTNTAAVLSALDGKFNITPALFLVPIALAYVIYKKVPPLPALLFGSLLGGVFAIIFQPELIKEMAGDSVGFASASYMIVLKAIYTKTELAVSLADKQVETLVNGLLSAKGMYGMLDTIWLIISAMAFGGIMEVCGFLKRMADTIIKLAHSTGSLIASTVGTCFFFNVTASDQYVAIVVPGRMYASTYKKRGLAPENLSRALEDSGTVTSVLIPWNTCGAAQSSVLGVSTFTYAPYCFFNIISPFMSIIFGYFDIKIKKLSSIDNEELIETVKEA